MDGSDGGGAAPPVCISPCAELLLDRGRVSRYQYDRPPQRWVTGAPRSAGDLCRLDLTGDNLRFASGDHCPRYAPNSETSAVSKDKYVEVSPDEHAVLKVAPR